MKSENSKLLLGLAIGAAVGTAVGYFVAADKKKLMDNLHHAVEDVKEGLKSVVRNAKTKAEETGAHVAGKTADAATKMAEKASQMKEKMEEAATGNK